MNTLELFEFPDFKGAFASIKQDIADLTSVGFLKKAQSLKICGDPWFIFSEAGYRGKFRCFKEGNYNSIPEFQKNISSVRLVKGGLYNPKITLYEHINYRGKSFTLDRPTDSLKPYGFDNMVSSHKWVSGAWILYTREYYTGDQMVALAGDENPDYRTLGWNDKVSSLKPVLPYEVSIKCEMC
ncbi:epidermal differentiation-specific protein-like [Aquarana catesbeiana]|uniref:epidermal differentiation-specific protein-like n=1 Tax=Aquarana catesbeiana TaxID=8400 RepID=UPI003CC96FCF